MKRLVFIIGITFLLAGCAGATAEPRALGGEENAAVAEDGPTPAPVDSQSAPGVGFETFEGEDTAVAEGDDLVELLADEGIDAPEAVPVAETEWNRPFPNWAACERPYSDDSLWNQRINWRQARPHPNSRDMINHFFQGDRPADPFVGSNPDIYKAPIFEVTSDQPLVEVKLRNSYRDSVQEGPNGELIESLDVRDKGEVQMLPLPPEAEPAFGTDGTLVVVVTDTGYEYGLREARRLADGTWEAAIAYEYHLSFDGVPEYNFQFRGADAPLLGGAVRPCEIERVQDLTHAVYFAYDYPASCEAAERNGWPCWIAPFTDSDGNSNDRWAIPEGARLAIDPRIPLRDVARACDRHIGCIIWVRAMQNYGGFVLDKSGRPSTYIEGNATAEWTDDLFKERALEGIPHEWFGVVDWNTEDRPPN